MSISRVLAGRGALLGDEEDEEELDGEGVTLADGEAEPLEPGEASVVVSVAFPEQPASATAATRSRGRARTMEGEPGRH
jgi:hypothetical protein